MKKKQKIQIIQPFSNLKDNWQLINQIQSSLNKYLNNPHIYTNLEPEDQNQKLGKLNLENIVRYIKNIVQVIENLKAEQKNVENIKLNAKIGQEKIEQHEEVIKNYQKKFNQRTKTLVDQNRMLKETIEKLKKNQVELQDNLKNRIQQKEQQISGYEKRQESMQAENKRLLLVINQLQDEIKNVKDKLFKLTRISDNDQNIKSIKHKIIQLAQYRRKYKRKDVQVQTISPPLGRSSFLQKLSLADIDAFSKFINFLTPKEICVLISLNKTLRLIIIKSKYCSMSLYRSIISVKNKKIGYYHQHIKYFENMYNKIPEQILQYTYFKYHILKDNVGMQIMQILNKSATIFEGKFIEGEQLYSGINQQPSQALHFKINLQQAHILDVDPSIIDEYNEERSQERQKLVKLFQNMYNKICNTYQLYRADLESSQMFISNILKHFSKVFVLSKNLYIQSQNLQQLNHFLLNELNKWDRMEIDKKLKIQDLKAELQAQKKLKLFFTDKSIKSEQKALIQQNLKLTFQMKYNKLTDSMNVTCAEKEELLKKYQILIKNLEVLSLQNKQNRKKYDFYFQKYNKVIQELTVVKETIVKMNI